MQTQLQPDPKLAPKQSHEHRLNILMLQVRHPDVNSQGSGPSGNGGRFNGPSYPERNRSPAAAWGRFTYFYSGKACSGGNSRGKATGWPGGWRAGRAGLRTGHKPAGRLRPSMVTA